MLALMAQGMFNAAVATDLHLAVKTVEAHVTSISVAASQGGHRVPAGSLLDVYGYRWPRAGATG